MSELEKTVADILVKATNAAEAAGKFAMEQLPDIAQQYVMYVAIWNALLVFLLVAIIAAAVLAIRWQFKWIAKWTPRNSYSDNERYFSLMPTGLIAFIGGGFLVDHLFNAVERFVLAAFAPKILLIQWAATLVK